MEPVKRLREEVLTPEQAIEQCENDDVRNVMESRDPEILKLLEEEDTWRRFTKRDMPEVYISDELPWWAVDAEDSPRWKVVYLWYRLAYTTAQKNLIEDYNAELEEEQISGVISKGAYPPGSRLVYKGFNVLKLISPNGKQLLDFRSQLLRIFSDMDDSDDELTRGKFASNSFYLFHNLFSFYSAGVIMKDSNQLSPEEKSILYIQKDVIDGVLFIFKQILQVRYMNLYSEKEKIANPDALPREIKVFKNRSTGYIDNNVLKSMRRVPRVYVPGNIIISTRVCASCRAPSPTKQCSCPCAAPYCGKQCQAEHHK
jgi:hypothetical protein